MRIETAVCAMCGGDDADIPVGHRWLCRPDAERISWHLAEIWGLCELCGVTVEQLRRELLR